MGCVGRQATKRYPILGRPLCRHRCLDHALDCGRVERPRRLAASVFPTLVIFPFACWSPFGPILSNDQWPTGNECQYLTHAPQHSASSWLSTRVAFADHADWPTAKRKPSKKYSRSSRIHQCSAVGITTGVIARRRFTISCASFKRPIWA
jgi:hypothetical protein